MKLKDRIAIVTGAGRGIGKAIALSLAQEGAHLVVCSRTRAEIEETAAKIRALDRRALAIKADISDREDVDNLVRSAIQEFGTIDILVNNAGIQGPIGPLVENDMDRWIQTIHINLIAVFLCSRAVLPIMMERRQGKIINLSGGGATSARPYFSAYAAAKAAVVRLTETLAQEVKEYNIQVNAIAPGTVNTRMLEEVLAAEKATGDNTLAGLNQQLQTAEGAPEKAAALAVFLASDESDGLSGRLLSAVWDNWQAVPRYIEEIMSSDIFTLRRVVR